MAYSSQPFSPKIWHGLWAWPLYKRPKMLGSLNCPHSKSLYDLYICIYKLIYYIWHHMTYIRLEGKKYMKALARSSQPLSWLRLLSSNSKIFALIRGFPNSSHTEESCPAIRLRLIRVTGVTGVTGVTFTTSESLYPLHDFIHILVGQGIYQPHFQIWLFQILSQGPIIASVQNQIWNWLQSSEQMFLRLSVETILSFPMFPSKHPTKSSSRDPESKPQCRKRLQRPQWPVWVELFLAHVGKAQRSLGKAKARPQKSTWKNGHVFWVLLFFLISEKNCMRFVGDIWQFFPNRDRDRIWSLILQGFYGFVSSCDASWVWIPSAKISCPCIKAPGSAGPVQETKPRTSAFQHGIKGKNLDISTHWKSFTIYSCRMLQMKDWKSESGYSNVARACCILLWF